MQMKMINICTWIPVYYWFPFFLTRNNKRKSDLMKIHMTNVHICVLTYLRNEI